MLRNAQDNTSSTTSLIRTESLKWSKVETHHGAEVRQVEAQEALMMVGGRLTVCMSVAGMSLGMMTIGGECLSVVHNNESEHATFIA